MEKNKVVFLHTPKTGGGAMEYLFYDQTKLISRNYFFNFNGLDDSRFYSDEYSTKHPNGNKCLIESIHTNKSIVERYNNSPHFKQCKFLMGHTTYSFGDLFPRYNFEYITVLRDPIMRTISNILQFTYFKDGEVKFGKHRKICDKGSDEYWNFIYDIMLNEYPIKGLLTHENHFLRNCQTRILQGAKYNDINEKVDLDTAIKNSKKIHFSFFDNFNEGLQKSFDKTNIKIDMSKNHAADKGIPKTQKSKEDKFGKYYGASDKLVELITELNKTDIELYNKLKDTNKNE